MLSQASQWGLVSVSRSMSCCDLSRSTQGLGSTGRGGTSPKGERKPEAFPKPGPRGALYGERIGLRQLRWKWGGMCVGGLLKSCTCATRKNLPHLGVPRRLSVGQTFGLFLTLELGYIQHLPHSLNSSGRLPAVLAGASMRGQSS